MKIKDFIKMNLDKGLEPLDLEILICNVLKKGKEFLVMEPDYHLKPNEFEVIEGFVERRLDGEPIAYIIGYKEFYGRKFFVDERCLIPRPETEFLVDKVIGFIGNKSKSVIDIGTGSGAICISLSKELPKCEVWGSEVSNEALRVTKKNREFHEAKVELVLGDLLSGIDREFNIIVANLPYIGTETNSCVSKDVDEYEPNVALYAGKDGLDLYRKLFDQIAQKKYKPELILGEMGFSQGELIKEVLLNSLEGYTIEVLSDLAGLDRYFIAERC